MRERTKEKERERETERKTTTEEEKARLNAVDEVAELMEKLQLEQRMWKAKRWRKRRKIDNIEFQRKRARCEAALTRPCLMQKTRVSWSWLMMKQTKQKLQP